MVGKHALPKSILFVCQMNMVRSPMAEGLMKKLYPSVITVKSCGLSQGDVDDWVQTVMSEVGVDLSRHEPKTLHDLSGQVFDIVIAFTNEAAQASEALFEDSDTQILHWPLPMPSEGSLDVRAVINNYRAMRDVIKTRLSNYFSNP